MELKSKLSYRCSKLFKFISTLLRRLSKARLFKKLKHSFTKLDPKRQRQVSLASFVLVFALVGTALLLASHAASPSSYASVNTDKGSVTFPATSQACTGASDGSCVTFNSGGSSSLGAMPLISRGVPAWSEGTITAASDANNDDYREVGGTQYGWVTTANFGTSSSDSNDDWLAYNLSQVPAVEDGQLSKIILLGIIHLSMTMTLG